MTPAAITPAGRAASKRRAPTRGGAPAKPAPKQSASATRAAAAGASASRAAAAGASASRASVASASATRASATSVPGHRHRVRPKAAPKVPRRISGPLRGRVTSRPPTPSRRQSATQSERRTRPATPLRARAVAFVRALPDHPLLDRLIRGRVWIPLLGVMLAGIVAMQVEVLKLGTSIGRSIDRSATLQTKNDELRMSVAALEGDERIERLAAAQGMIMPAPDQVGFLSFSRSHALVNHAVDNIHSPDAPSFLSVATTNGGIASLASSQAASSALPGSASSQTVGADPSSSSTDSSSTAAAPRLRRSRLQTSSDRLAAGGVASALRPRPRPRPQRPPRARAKAPRRPTRARLRAQSRASQRPRPAAAPRFPSAVRSRRWPSSIVGSGFCSWRSWHFSALRSCAQGISVPCRAGPCVVSLRRNRSPTCRCRRRAA